MVLGVQHSKQMIVDIEKLVEEAIKIAKHGAGIGAIHDIFAILEDIKEMIAEAPLALPELKDLNPEEVGELTAAAYAMVKQIMAAVVK